MFFIQKYIKIIFFYFLKIIFNISTSKRYKNTKILLILKKKNSKFSQIVSYTCLDILTHNYLKITFSRISSFFFSIHCIPSILQYLILEAIFVGEHKPPAKLLQFFFFSQNQLNSRKKAHNHLNFFFGFHH
jgi:hypothetical protein